MNAPLPRGEFIWRGLDGKSHAYDAACAECFIAKATPVGFDVVTLRATSPNGDIACYRHPRRPAVAWVFVEEGRR